MQPVFRVSNRIRKRAPGSELNMMFHIGQVLQVSSRHEVNISVGKRSPRRSYEERSPLEKAFAANIEVRDVIFDKPVYFAIGCVEALLVQRHIRSKGKDVQEQNGRTVNGCVQREARQRVQIHWGARNQSGRYYYACEDA